VHGFAGPLTLELLHRGLVGVVDRDALGHEGLEALEIGGRRHGIEKFLDPAVDFRLRGHRQSGGRRQRAMTWLGSQRKFHGM